MFRTGAALLARGALGALISGLINATAFIISMLPAGSRNAWMLSMLGLEMLFVAIVLYGALFAPISMALLPLTWLSFRRGRYLRLALVAIGIIGGSLWSIKVGIFRGGQYSEANLFIGALCGLVSSWLFLGLRSPMFVGRLNNQA
jgi:hypothetical protein